MHRFYSCLNIRSINLAIGRIGIVDLLYQFWIHTELIGKLGWFDRIFASPSNHRVHHGVNDQYLELLAKRSKNELSVAIIFV